MVITLLGLQKGDVSKYVTNAIQRRPHEAALGLGCWGRGCARYATEGDTWYTTRAAWWYGDTSIVVRASQKVIKTAPFAY